MAKGEMYPVESHDVTTYYVWDGFVRTSHWINVAAVAVLIYTGIAIGSPSCRPPVQEPLQGMPMATMKNLHFLAAVIFTLNGLAATGSLRAAPTGSGSVSTSGASISGRKPGGN